MTQILSDVVETKILDYIREEGLQPGDALPKESELGEAVDVGRNMLREGLSRLRMLGIVESRRRRGMCVARPQAFSGFKRVLKSGLLQQEAFEGLMELRIMLEIGLAPFLIARLTEEGLGELREICATEKKARDAVERLECELAFHRRIYQQADNPLLLELQELLEPFFLKYARSRKKRSPRQDHSALLAALEARDTTGYIEAVRSHMDLYLSEVK